MLDQTTFLSRAEFECVEPWPGDAAISIGDPGQETPAILARYGEGQTLRLQFLDGDPVSLPGTQVITLEQAQAIRDFVHALHASDWGRRLVVHCEGGACRSAAIALYAQAITGCALNEREARYANVYVLQQLRAVDPQFAEELDALIAEVIAFQKDSAQQETGPFFW